MTAVNPLRGEATLDAGERGTLTLVYDVNAFCYAEGHLGKTTDQIVAMVQEEFAGWDQAAADESRAPRVNATLTRALLWAGLQKRHPGTHMIEAGEIMSDAGLGETVAAVLNGVFAFFGKAEEDGDSGDPPKKPKKGGTG